MTKSITCFIFLIGALISSIAEAQSPERLDRGLEKIRAKYDLPALAAAIVTPDRITAIGIVGELGKSPAAPVPQFAISGTSDRALQETRTQLIEYQQENIAKR